MKLQPTISVCLPVYNGEKYLTGAVESVLQQSFENFELLIVDDCSTDSTWEIANQLALHDKRIKPIRNENNLGLFPNYNRCMANATGKFIKLFAHDDLFRPTILENMLAVFEKRPEVALVATAKGWIDAEGNLLEPTSASELRTMRPFKEDTQLAADEAIGQTLRKMSNWLGEPCSQMFRREHCGSGFDTRFKQVGDLDFAYNILQHGDYFFLSEVHCFFRKHKESNTHQFSRSLAAWLDWFLIAAHHKAYLPKAGLTEDEYCQLLTRRLAGILYEAQSSGPKESRTSITGSFLGREEAVLNRFGGAGEEPRDSKREYEALCVLAMLALCDLQTEIMLATNQHEHNQVKIDSLRKEISQVRKTRSAEVEELRSSLGELGNSLSWKLTEPLRSWNKIIQR